VTSAGLPNADGVLSALGDPTRRRMVEALGRGPLSVTRLAEPFDMSLTAVGQHLRVLEECGLVATEKVGRVRTCRLRSEGLDALVTWVAQQRSDWDRRLDRLVELAGGS
jgi:DNA-binding transcriptional ArsR family regulator